MPRKRAGLPVPSPPMPRGPVPTTSRQPASPTSAQPRRRNCELDTNLRTQIVTLKEVAKWSYGQIHKKYPTIPLSTIKYTCLKSRIRDKEQSLNRSGRSKILNDDDRQKVLQKIHEDPQISYDDLLSEVNHKWKKDSIARLLSIEGLRKWRVMKHPYLKPEHAAAGLSWALRYQHYTKDDFDRVFCSDECTVERGIGLRPAYSFIRPSDQAVQGEVQPVPHRGFQVKQMFRGATAP
jgi:hypothetical protein